MLKPILICSNVLPRERSFLTTRADFHHPVLQSLNLASSFDPGRNFDFHHLVLKCLNMASSSSALFEEAELRRRISKDLMNDILAMDQLPIDEEKLFEFFLK